MQYPYRVNLSTQLKLNCNNNNNKNIADEKNNNNNNNNGSQLIRRSKTMKTMQLTHLLTRHNEAVIERLI